ncbi:MULTISPECIES: TetR/AcrR family transcriptional regulator [Burkholderia]|uniref:TetR family transcriptional regulator n=1 Tax=Burkholderia aenigmatica TaxID=2015348 RepID=A0ABY6XN81_9BURK|nr:MULTISPECIES: TetR/AcrR family transcriptional regulator [Burkholderia]VWC58029.1 TetR family transcriptional regulator [Burkholderia aenigmatica]VWC83429.1 TetR family transcriptional regulator [Burkholderia aenigmatica]
MSRNPGNQKAGYHHGNLRQAVLDLAFAALEHANGRELSVRHLATQLGVSDSAVYRHFVNKEALLVALVVEGFRRLTQVQIDAFAAEISRGASARDAFRAGGLAHVKFAHAHAELFRLMHGGFAVQHRDDAELVQARRENSEVTTQAIRRMVGSTIDEQQIRAFSVGVRSFVHGFAMLWIDGHLEGGEAEIEALAEAAFEFSMHAFPDAVR